MEWPVVDEIPWAPWRAALDRDVTNRWGPRPIMDGPTPSLNVTELAENPFLSEPTNSMKANDPAAVSEKARGSQPSLQASTARQLHPSRYDQSRTTHRSARCFGAETDFPNQVLDA